MMPLFNFLTFKAVLSKSLLLPQPWFNKPLSRGGYITLLMLPLLIVSTTSCSNNTSHNTAADSVADQGAPSNDSIMTLSTVPEAADALNDNSPINPNKSTSDLDWQRSPMIADAPTSDLGAILIGDYMGTWPCADCDGLRVELNLLSDGTALKSITPIIDSAPSTTAIKSGHYQQIDNIIVVTLDHQVESYLIDDQQLLLLRGDYSPNHKSDSKATAKDFSDLDYSLMRR